MTHAIPQLMTDQLEWRVKAVKTPPRPHYLSHYYSLAAIVIVNYSLIRSQLNLLSQQSMVVNHQRQVFLLSSSPPIKCVYKVLLFPNFAANRSSEIQ